MLFRSVYCGHCGGKLTLTSSGRKRIKADGTIHRETRSRYQCHYNVRHPGECDGQSGYGVSKLDRLVDQIIHIQFERIRNVPHNALVAQAVQREVELAKAQLNLLVEQHRQKEREYQDLRAEAIKVVQGTSRLNADLLNSLVEETAGKIADLEQQIQKGREELQTLSHDTKKVDQEYAQLLSWADMYDSCTFEAKKMIVAQFVKAVSVKRDYEIDITFNVSFEEFQKIYLVPETEEEKQTKTPLSLELKETMRQAG